MARRWVLGLGRNPGCRASTDHTTPKFVFSRSRCSGVQPFVPGRRDVGEPLVQAHVVEPADVFDDGQFELRACSPNAVGDQLCLKAVDERLGERVSHRGDAVRPRADGDRFGPATPPCSPGGSLGRFQPALGLPGLLRRLDPRRSGGWGEDARVAVFPADSEARRLLLEHLLDHAFARRLGNPLRLDDDQVSHSRHFLLTSGAQLEARV
jgi:hypothetical protein